MAAQTIDAPTLELDADPSITSSYLAGYREERQLDFPDAAPPVEEKPATPAQASAEAPVPDAPAPPVADPNAGKSRPEAARRVQERDRIKSLETELETLRRERDEFKSFKETEAPKWEQTLAEQKAVAENYQKDLEKYKNGFKNDLDQDWKTLATEIPAYREALDGKYQAWSSLIPPSISNPDADEPEEPLSAADLQDHQQRQLEEMAGKWASWRNNGQLPGKQKAGAQHILVSHMAKILGVDPANFDETEFDGKVYSTIRPSHPVYKHLVKKLPDYVDSKSRFEQIESAVKENSKGAASEAIRTRQENTRNYFRQAGLGMDGEELKTRMQREPNNPVLQAMSQISEDPELLAELKAEMENEVVVNGFFSPRISLTDEDPEQHATNARAFTSRIAARAVMAPLAMALNKLASKRGSEIQELRKKVAKLEEENKEIAYQEEPGIVSTSGNTGGNSQVTTTSSPYLQGWAKERGY